MFAQLTGSLGWGPKFPYTLDPLPVAERSWGQWQHYKGVSQNDNSAVSIFKISDANPNDPKLVAARNGVKRLKMVRG